MIRVFPLFALLILFSTTASAFNKAIPMYIRDDVYIDYTEFVKNKDVLNISDFSGKTVRRDVVDMIIAQQALYLGGFEYTFNYIPGKVNFRNTRMLQKGQLLMSFDSYWKSDALSLSKDVHISSPVVRLGEYFAGIYTHPDNKKVLNVSKLEDLKPLTAVSTPKWKTDWRTLQSLPLAEVVREDEWLSMARMVNMQWIDFMLMPFHNSNDQSFEMEKIHLVPVPDVAVILQDSRHFVISRHHKFGNQAFEAIQKGLIILRQRGTIKKAYTEAGFFIDQSKYTILNKG